MKGFNEQEKVLIKERLISNGKEIFEKFGLKKTSVSELTKSVQIAQGSFYIFYKSKEELYFDVLMREEEKKIKFYDEIINSKKFNKEGFKEFLRKLFEFLNSSNIFQNVFKNNEYEMLVRKLPKELIESHFKDEKTLLFKLLEKGKSCGYFKNIDIEEFFGFFYTIFILILNKDQYEGDLFEKSFNLVINSVVDSLFKK